VDLWKLNVVGDSALCGATRPLSQSENVNSALDSTFLHSLTCKILCRII